MITQNLFNTRPKTFMDYEPGKIPKKEEWASQSTTQTKTYDPFASNVKLVGDDVTEKDYDTFFEGFNSVNILPLQKETRSAQKPKLRDALYRPSVDGEPTIQTLPYIPSVHGEPKIQKFSYSPSENGEANISLYSATTPTHIKVKNASQKSEETLWDKAWDKIKEPWVDRKNLLDELERMYGDLSLEARSAMKTAFDPREDKKSREAAAKIIKDEIMRIHYGRNRYNVGLPKNKEQAEKWGWKTVVANCHQFTAPDEEHDHIKYVSPDGKREVMFDYTGTKVITADEDVGTYNYADPDLWLAHFVVDILPWMRYGNTTEDSTEWYERVGGFLGFGN